MATYNGQKYIREQVDSILAQSFTDWELVVCDDCSTDKTVEILNEYAQKDSRIKVYKNLDSFKAESVGAQTYYITNDYSKGATYNTTETIDNSTIQNTISYETVQNFNQQYYDEHNTTANYETINNIYSIISNIISNILMKEENVMKKTIKSALSKGVSAMLNRTLTSGADASSSYYFSQPVEPASLKKFKKTR